MKSSAKDQPENTAEKITGKVHEKIVQSNRVIWTGAADHALDCSSDLGCCCKMHPVRDIERYDVFGIKEFKSNCNNNLNLRRKIDQSAVFQDGRGDVELVTMRIKLEERRNELFVLFPGKG